MVEDRYAQLAKALNALPGGFPESPSHVELQLVKRHSPGQKLTSPGRWAANARRAESWRHQWHPYLKHLE